MVLDSEQLKKNAQTLLEKFPNAKIILKKADGKKNYQQLAKELEINKKIVSPALSLAKELGFGEKIKPGIYKKITPLMKLIPNKKEKIKEVKSVDSIIKKFLRKNPKVSIPKKSITFNYENKVDKMVLAYKLLFITENILRDLIRRALGHISNWWEDRVPKDIKDKVEEAILNSKYDDATRKDNLEYTHIGQLKEIITWKKNWDDLKPFLKSADKSNFEHELKKVISSRNAIGHCIPLVGDDYKDAEIRFKNILKLLK